MRLEFLRCVCVCVCVCVWGGQWGVSVYLCPTGYSSTVPKLLKRQEALL